jgi:hypothetical protein
LDVTYLVSPGVVRGRLELVGGYHLVACGRQGANRALPNAASCSCDDYAPAQVTDADFAAAKASGFSEDQLFELVICAAVGQSARLYEAGLAALAEATAGGEAG